MAFPTVTSVTPYSFPSASTSHVFSIGSFTPGDLMVLLICYEADNGYDTIPGWEPLVNGYIDNLTLSVASFVRIYESGDTSVDIVTADSVVACGQIYRIAAGTWYGDLSGVFDGGAASGSSTTPNPNVLNVPIAQDYLWLAVYGADDDDDASAYPASFTNGTYTEASASGTTCSMGSARRNENTNSQNPGTFTIAATEEWGAFTLAIAPARPIEILGLDRNSIRYGSPLTITGVTFGTTSAGSAKVEIANNAVYGSATLIDIIDDGVVDSWANEQIELEACILVNVKAGDNWIYVTNSNGDRSAGFPIQVVPYVSGLSVTDLYDGLTGVDVTGHGFGSTKGASKVYLSNSPNFNSGILTEQTTTGWTNTTIEFTVETANLIRGIAYFFVQVNPVSYPFEVYLFEVDFTPPAVFEDGSRQISAEIYPPGLIGDQASINGYVKLLTCEIEEIISGIGNWSATISKTDPGSSAFTIGCEVIIAREGEADLFYGIVDNIQETHGRDGEKLIAVRGYELSAELLRDSTYRGIFLKDELFADAVDEILVDTTWTPLITGTGYTNIYTRFDDKTKISALFDLAALKTAYVRSTDTAREIEIKNYHTDSYIRLLPVESMDVRMRDNSVLGFYETQQRTISGEEVWNRVVPEAKSDSERYYDLNGATNDTPYDIRSKFITSPNLVNQIQDGENAGIIDSFIEVIGENRFLVVFITYHFDAGSPSMVAVLAGGALMTLRDSITVPDMDAPGTDGAFEVWTLTNPPKGNLSIQGIKDDLYTGVLHFTLCQAVSFSDVDQVDPLRDIVMHFGTSSGISESVESLPGDLVVDAIISNFGDDNDGTEGAGQELIGVESGGRPRGSMKVATGATTTMSWTGNTAADWGHAILTLKPALTWYIQDDGSVSNYGLRTKVAPFGERVPAEVLDIVPWLNIMYDQAADFLIKHKEPTVSYQVTGVIMPQPASYWRVGDIMSVFDEDLNEDVILICTRRRAIYRDDGIRTWDLDLSTTVEAKKNYDEAFKEAFERLNILQFRQV
jgi:hypothetical protein